MRSPVKPNTFFLLLSIATCCVCVSAATPSCESRFDKEFTRQQNEWLCEAVVQWEKLANGISGKFDAGVDRTSRQGVFLDFLQRCSGNDCVEFRFPSDEEEMRKANELRERSRGKRLLYGSDWRCSHPEITWRPLFCALLPPTTEKESDDFRTKRQTQRMARRKEYRMLTPTERHRLHLAMNRMKTQTVDNTSKWDIMTTNHYAENAPSAHWGPAFLPWHREFLRQFEVALRNEDPDIALPYWDTTLDWGLPDARDSVLWGDEFLGNGNGHVTTGPFADWQSTVPLPGHRHITKLYRSIGLSPIASLMSPMDVDWLLSRKNFSELTFCVDRKFEMVHGLNHLWVGGFMHVTRNSPNDPSFYLLHSYVDYLWEQFRQTLQTAAQRSQDYVTKSQLCNWRHGGVISMAPFAGLSNRDGLSNDYTSKWYSYEPSPKCSQLSPNCGSPYLFCDLYENRCRSKILPGGRCDRLPDRSCYNSNCLHGICTKNMTGQISFNEMNRPKVFLKAFLMGKGGRPISDRRYRIVVRGENYYGKATFHTPSMFAYPETKGIAYIQVARPGPKLPLSKSRVWAFDAHNRPCQAYCRIGQRLSPCDGSVTISKDVRSSNSISFTHSSSTKRFLSTQMVGHPSTWRAEAPHLAFFCDFETNSTLANNNFDKILPQMRTSQHVWFKILVLDKGKPFDSKVVGAVARAVDLDDIAQSFQVTVDSGGGFPYDSGVVFLRARNPYYFQQTVRLNLTVSDAGGKICELNCSNDCSNSIQLSADAEKSDNLPFTDDLLARNFIGWNMTGHPRGWSHELSQYKFYC